MSENDKFTLDELEEIRGTKIDQDIKEKVLRSIPDSMHLDKRGFLRYKRGQNPHSINKLKELHKEGKANKFEKGQSGFEGRKHLTPKILRNMYREKLLKKGIDGKDTIAEELTDKHLHVLYESFRKLKYNEFNKYLADFAAISGEFEKDQEVQAPTIQQVFVLPEQRPVDRNEIKQLAEPGDESE